MTKTSILLSFFLSISVAICGCSSTSQNAQEPKILTKEITYSLNGKSMTGFIARPRQVTSATPAVLVVHEWWGQTDYPRKRARMLAEMGFIAMAADMYGERKIALHPKDAGAFAKSVMSDSKVVRSRFVAALETLKSQPGVDTKKVAAIGYCFGGSVVLEMARQGVAMAGVVSFHGGLKTPTRARKDQITPRILVLHGEADKFVSATDVNKFETEMRKAGASYEIVTYKGALHGFTNPRADDNAKRFKIPLGYSAEADSKSWKKMDQFFAQIFQGKKSQ